MTSPTHDRTGPRGCGVSTWFNFAMGGLALAVVIVLGYLVFVR